MEKLWEFWFDLSLQTILNTLSEINISMSGFGEKTNKKSHIWDKLSTHKIIRSICLPGRKINKDLDVFWSSFLCSTFCKQVVKRYFKLLKILRSNPASKIWFHKYILQTSPSNVSKTCPQDPIWRSRERPDLSFWGRHELLQQWVTRVVVFKTSFGRPSENVLETLSGHLSNSNNSFSSFLLKNSFELIYLNSLQYCLVIFGMIVVGL